MTETDVMMMAIGHWEKYFQWRIHPKVKVPLWLSAIAVGLVLLIVVATAGVQPAGETSQPGVYTPISAVVIVLAIGALIGMLYSFWVYGRERSDFARQAAAAWGKDPDFIPNWDYVHKYVNGG